MTVLLILNYNVWLRSRKIWKSLHGQRAHLQTLGPNQMQKTLQRFNFVIISSNRKADNKGEGNVYQIH